VFLKAFGASEATIASKRGIAPQRIPQRVKTQIAVSHMAPWQFGCFRQAFNCAVLVARPRINDRQVLD
jgi:hypothetical protein